jgi:hypothetical protein
MKAVETVIVLNEVTLARNDVDKIAQHARREKEGKNGEDTILTFKIVKEHNAYAMNGVCVFFASIVKLV